MKHFKTLLILAVIVLGFSSMTAQTKVAHINFRETLMLMPEAKAMSAALEKLTKTYEDDLKAQASQLQAKLKRYDAEAASQTQEVNAQRAQEVQQDQQNFQLAQQTAQQELQKKESDDIKPIFEKLKTTIEAVAKEQGYDYVLEFSSLIVANGTDLTPLVKAKLGIQ